MLETLFDLSMAGGAPVVNYALAIFGLAVNLTELLIYAVICAHLVKHNLSMSAILPETKIRRYARVTIEWGAQMSFLVP